MIYISDIVQNTVVDGPGFRTSIYCSGCEHKCPKCHNKDTWDINAGVLTSIDDIMKKISEQPHNVTFSGGDPLLQIEGFTKLAKLVKESGRTIWCYTGFTFEYVYKNEKLNKILPYIDVLVDGRFEEDKKDLSAIFRGSSNQRLIDVQASLQANGNIIEYNYSPYPIF